MHLPFILPEPLWALRTPQAIKTRLESLIRNYLRSPSSPAASAVAQCLDALCAHPDYVIPEVERCDYRRLARHWRCLAWINQAESSGRFGRERAVGGPETVR